jgi:hypothetical protein
MGRTAKSDKTVHYCTARGCQEVIPANRVMCEGHWKIVPLGLKQGIEARWRAANAPDATERDRRMARMDWDKACLHARRVVASKEGRVEPRVCSQVKGVLCSDSADVLAGRVPPCPACAPSVRALQKRGMGEKGGLHA